MVSNAVMRWFRFPFSAPPSSPPSATPSSALIQTGPSPVITSTTEEPSPDETRVVKITMGSCTFIHHKWGPCDCKTGSTITPGHHNGNCKTCGHDMQVHRSYGHHYHYSPPNQPLHPDICPRSETITKLVEMLDELGVIHIRGTPASGKTTLAKLLREYCISHGRPFVFMTGWPDTSDPEQLMAEKCEEAGFEGTNTSNLYDRKVTFIMDEAQATYYDTQLWLTFFKAQSNRQYGPRICLFASYGSPQTGLIEAPYGTPLRFGPQQRVSILKPRVKDAPDVHLFYNEEEFKDAIQKCCSGPWSTFDMDPEACDYLYFMTNGHPGAVSSLVSYVNRQYRSDLKKGNIDRITKEHLLRSLDDDQFVFRCLENTDVYRSFPSLDKLTVPAADTLRKVLQEKVIPCDLKDPGVDYCCKMGWLHSDIPDEEALKKAEVVCFFPSPLHRKFVEHFLQVHDPKPFPFARFPSITSLCEAVLREFSRKNLCMGSRSVYDKPTLSHPPEAHFQDELYRAFHSLVGHGVGISSEWTRAGDGRIDFRITEPGWGIELLRDGNRLSEHCNRFLPGGAYHRWITEGLLEDWLIIDCRHSSPHPYNVINSKLWRVVFGEGYSFIRVLGCSNEVIVPEFPLFN